MYSLVETRHGASLQLLYRNMPELDIAQELAKLHTLSGAAYSKQVERIAQKMEVDFSISIFKTGAGAV